MRYLALASDYDGTLAHEGRADPHALIALEAFRTAGGKLVLVTGRELGELRDVFPQVDVFDRVIAENGALLYTPETRAETLLGSRPPVGFVNELRARGVGPISIGRVVVATWQPHARTVADVIRSHGLDLRVILNKRAVMVLPAGVNKGSGLRVALAELGVAPEQAVAIGDAENDCEMFEVCGLSVAVANASPAVKTQAQIVTRGERGAGVVELVERLLSDVATDHSAAIQ